MSSKKRVFLLLSMSLAIVVTMACSCSNVVRRARELKRNSSQPVSTPTQLVERTVGARSHPLTVTPSPTALPEESPILELSEEEINSFLTQELASIPSDQVQVSQVNVKITDQELLISADVFHPETGVSGVITLYGTPNVVKGMLYIQVTRIELGESFGGLTRLIARTLIEEAIQEYSTENGIPVPLEGYIKRVTLEPGRIIIYGDRP